MSVIRQPGILGQTTRQRLVGVTAACSAGVVETVAVGSWFALLVGTRSATTALVGLGLLFCGSLLRASVFGATVGELETLRDPRRLAVALLLASGWVVWLLLAEAVGGEVGALVATVVLGAILALQFSFERIAFQPWSADRDPLAAVVPAALLAVGAAALLGSAWFVDWTLVSPPLSLGVATVVLEITSTQLGIVGFGICAIVAHQRRFQRVLGV